MRRLPLLFSLFILLCGCGKSASDARTTDEFRMNLAASQDLAEIDVALDSLQDETDDLKENYDKLQATLLPHVKLESVTEQATQLTIYINENSVLIVNDTPMSRNDFVQYADKNLPALCQPTPRLTIHTKAIYDTAAWVLDSLYSHGCPDVTIE